jgi:prephenate dehydrogenase
MSTLQKVVIVGGAKGIGLWLCNHLFRDHCEVAVIDLDQRALSRLPVGIERVSMDDSRDPEILARHLTAGSALLLATPMHALKTVAETLLPHLCDDVLVLQCASVQVAGEEAVRPSVPARCSYLGMHPMFGPALTTPVGQIIALTSYRDDDSAHRSLREFLHGRGVITTTATAREHDEAMSYVQVLSHFTLLSFANALGTRDKSFSALTKFRTPPFQFLSAFAGRLLKSAPGTIMGIQTAEGAAAIREHFLTTATKFHQSICDRESSPAALAGIFEEIRLPFSGEEIDEATMVSSIAVDSIQEFDSVLHKYHTSKDAFFIRHRDNQRLLVGVIEEIRADEILFRPCMIPVSRPEGERFAVAFNAVAELNYKRLGISFPPSMKRITLKKRKIVLLSKGEVRRWIAQNVLCLTRQQGFQNPHGYDGQSIERIVPQLLPGVRRCRYIESYQREGKPDSVTLALTIAPWESIPNVSERIQSFLNGT